MSDPQDNRPKTPRAEPSQPDKPLGGADANAQRGNVDKKTVDRQKDQSKAALDNVRKGYN